MAGVRSERMHALIAIGKDIFTMDTSHRSPDLEVSSSGGQHLLERNDASRVGAIPTDLTKHESFLVLSSLSNHGYVHLHQKLGKISMKDYTVHVKRVYESLDGGKDSWTGTVILCDSIFASAIASSEELVRESLKRTVKQKYTVLNELLNPKVR